jgi:hypothetical protein
MFMSQIKRFISVGATHNASAGISSGISCGISSGSKPSKSITWSFPTADIYSNVSNFRLKPTINTTTNSTIFTEAGKCFHSTACNEIKVKNIVNDYKSMIESRINFPSKNQINQENIRALKYIVIQTNSGRWTEMEKNKFKAKLMELSRCSPMNPKVFFQKLSNAVESRTVKQCKQHYDYYYKIMDIVV